MAISPRHWHHWLVQGERTFTDYLRDDGRVTIRLLTEQEQYERDRETRGEGYAIQRWQDRRTIHRLRAMGVNEG